MICMFKGHSPKDIISKQVLRAHVTSTHVIYIIYITLTIHCSILLYDNGYSLLMGFSFCYCHDIFIQCILVALIVGLVLFCKKMYYSFYQELLFTPNQEIPYSTNQIGQFMPCLLKLYPPTIFTLVNCSADVLEEQSTKTFYC